MNKLVAVLAAAVLAMPAWADFSYERTSQITGGSLLRMMKMVPGGGKATQPQTSRMILKGNKLADVSTEKISIIDLDSKTMTDIDLKDKKYSVITFEEFRAAMDAMRKKMSQQQKSQADAPEFDFRVNVQETGESKTIEGMGTKQFIMTLATDIKDAKSGQTITTEMKMDMWNAPGIPGYQQVQDFYAKMAKEMAWVPGMMGANPMVMGQPGFSEGMAKLIQEASKLKGVPVFEVMTMEGFGGPGMPEMGEMPNLGEAASEGAQRSAENAAASQAGRALGGRLGGLAGGALGGFGRRKKAEPPPEEKPAAAPQPAKKAAFMEVTVQSRNFSSATADGSAFVIPAGFKQVEHDLKKQLK